MAVFFVELFVIFLAIMFIQKPLEGVNSLFIAVKSKIEKVTAKCSLLYTSFFMLCAHMYAFTHGSLLFDSVGVYRGAPIWNSISDRWLVNVYWILDMGVNQPWLAGLLSILFMTVSVYCISDVLKIKGKFGIFLIAGICSTQSSIVCQMEYTGQNFYGIIALMWACLASWVLITTNSNRKGSKLLGILFIVFSAATYGPYVSVVTTLMIFDLLRKVVSGEDGRLIWKKSFHYVGVFALAMGLYYAVFRILYACFGVPLTDYMGKSAMVSVNIFSSMANSIVGAYKSIISYYLFNSPSYIPFFLGRLQTVIIVLGGMVFAVRLLRRFILKGTDFWSVSVTAACLCVLPLSINLIYVMASGQVHFLMNFTYCLPAVFTVYEYERIPDIEGKTKAYLYSLRKVLAFMMCIFLYFGIVMSNSVYVHYENMFTVAQSIGTRILDRIETCDGFDGEEEIILFGALQWNDYYNRMQDNGSHGAEILDAFLGPGNSDNINALNYASWTKRFLLNVLQTSLDFGQYYERYDDCFSEINLLDVEKQILFDMECFPRSGSVKKIGNRIFVKLSEGKP